MTGAEIGRKPDAGGRVPPLATRAQAARDRGGALETQGVGHGSQASRQWRAWHRAAAGAAARDGTGSDLGAGDDGPHAGGSPAAAAAPDPTGGRPNMARFVETFKEFPPRQRPSSFSVEH